MKSNDISEIRMNALRSAGTFAMALAALMPSVAIAQTAPENTTKASKADDGDIVVTGTSLRKTAPAGAQEFSVSSQSIEATGAQSTDQLLATIPQLNSFGTLQTANAGGTQLTVNRTNLRNLPQGVGGSSPTLVLMDGHRIVGEGAKQSYPDPDVIPPALIERVDVLTDGGSAIYGSDAVGGVINFVTKKNFDGIDVGIRHGFGDSYSSTDANFTVGKSWGTGSVYVGYNYAEHDPILNANRSFVKDINWATGAPAGLNCTPGNVTTGSGATLATYAVVGGNSLVAGTANKCNDAAFGDFYPKEVRHSVMAGFRQELTSSIEFDVKGYYSARTDTSDGGPIKAQGTLYGAYVPAFAGYPQYGVPGTPAIYPTPGYISTGGGSTATQTAYFNFGPVGGEDIVSTKLWAYGITPTLTWKIGHDWQMKAYYNYGQSQTTAYDPQVNSTILAADIQAGTINPYNVAASNTAALAQALNYVDYVIGKDTMSNAKVTFDGPLFKLPGGDLRVAVGGEYLYEKYAGTVQQDTYQNVAIAPLSPASRNVKAGFVEASIPLVGKDNHIPLIYSLSLSAQERYDKYSDFGGNWAPNLGLSWKPISWVNFRARWNKSFQAPSLVQLSQATTPQTGVFPAAIVAVDAALVNPAVAFNGGPVVAIQGTVSPLQPERARDYNLGVDISPPFVQGLNIHFTYFNINYAGAIGTPPLGYGQFYGVASYANLFQMLPSNAQITTFLTNAGIPAAQIANVLAQVPNNNAYVVADVRSRNLGLTKINGFDVSFDFQHQVSFGQIYAKFDSTYLNSSLTAVDGVNFQPDQAGINGPAFSATTMLGVKVGDSFRGQVTWNYKDKFNLDSSTITPTGQTSVGAYSTFDLYMQYDLKKLSVPFSLSLGVTNMFNTNPPVYTGTTSSFGYGYANGSNAGRVFQLGASVKF